ncbi:hypothetical protein Pcinc_040120 [Petrolisthes cinctipes]|uniref:Uncharacterized protein n=1 Tax=Petrolisthes cinctipes TaxID=88211 RepID=A0AAE1BMV6_PETCI|nr:hypothetical protein Pcinc_040120 [Petrolisthes cinctipes]
MSSPGEGEVWPVRTPASLERQVLDKLVTMVLEAALPITTANLPLTRTHGYGRSTEPWEESRCRRLDDIIMATDTTRQGLLPEKKVIMDRLQKVRTWWDSGLSAVGYEVARIARRAVSLELQLIDPHAFFPLTRLILQLLFSSTVGTPDNVAEFPADPKTRLELRMQACPVYAEVLRDLAPFSIEELNTQHIIFGDVEPWEVVLDRCWGLRRVHLRHNTCDRLLSCLPSCSLLHTFILDECCGRTTVPVDTLYQMFFRGRDHQEISELVASFKAVDHQTLLSFPNLKLVDLGNNWDSYKGDGGKSMTELRYNLIYFYPKLESLSCEKMQPFQPSAPPTLPPHCRNLTFGITHIDLNLLMWWTKYQLDLADCEAHKREREKVVMKAFRQVRHLSHTHASEVMKNDKTAQQLADFAKIWIPKFKCEVLTVKFPFTFPPTRVDLGEYVTLLSGVGKALRVLRLHLSCGMVAVGGLYPLLACCPYLEVLGLVWARGAAGDEGQEKRVVSLPRLAALSVVVQDGAGAGAVESLVEKLLSSCPALATLELVLPHRPCEWLMGLAAQQTLAKIRTLRLSFRPAHLTWQLIGEEVEVGVAFYVPFIELLPRLEVLLLGSLPLSVYRWLARTYRTSQLRILPRPRPLTHILHPYL